MKGRAALKVAAKGQAGAWATVPLMLLPVPHWLYSALDWGGGLTALASLLTVIVVLTWNVFGSREEAGPAQGRRPRPGESPARVTAPPVWDQGITMAHAVIGFSRLQQQLRYVNQGGPVFTPPHGTRLPEDVTWVQGSPVMSSGRCGKCGELMAWHSYYGRGPCVTLGVVQPEGTKVVPAKGYAWCDFCLTATVSCSLDHSRWITPEHAHRCKRCA